MIKLVPGFLAVLLSLPSALATTPAKPFTLLEAFKYSKCTVDSYEKGDRVCQEAVANHCREFSDSRCEKLGLKSERTLTTALNETNATKALEALNKVKAESELCCGTDLKACLGTVAPEYMATDESGTGEGMLAICTKLKDKTVLGANVNARVAGNCLSRKAHLGFECEQVVAKHCTMDSACTEDEAKAMIVMKSACPSMVPDVSTLRKQVDSMTEDSKLAALCEGGSSTKPGETAGVIDENHNGVPDDQEKPEDEGDVKPSSVGKGAGDMASALMPLMQSLFKQPEPEEKEDIDCVINPANCPDDQQKAEGPTPMNPGSSQPVAAESFTPEFDPASMPNAPNDLGIQAASTTPGAGGTIPNGGGGFPNAPGGGMGGLGNPQRGGGGGVDPKKIGMDGFNSPGSYASTNQKLSADVSGGNGGYRQPVGQEDPGFDLKPFMGLDKKRGLASGMAPQNAEISNAGVNMWLKVSDRFKSRCNQGLLRDCTNP